MAKKVLAIIVLISFSLTAQTQFSKISSMPGAFSRMGFGARGISMGNSLSAVTEGNLVAYYNPAVTAFQSGNSFQASYTFLSLDRSLNFLSFTRKFDFYSFKDSSSANLKPRASAGLSVGIINSGVSKIDGRDNQGISTGELSTSENLFFMGVANKFSDKFSIGISFKFYYYKLYEDVNSTGIGLDIGGIYVINEQWNVAVVLSDLNSKYKWDSSPVYDQQGGNYEDKFPLLKKIGLRYKNSELKLLAAAELESSNAESNILRFGVEYNIFENLFLRGGIDQLNLSSSDMLPKPALGFSYSRLVGALLIGIDYAFMIEQYSSSDRHVAGVQIIF